MVRRYSFRSGLFGGRGRYMGSERKTSRIFGAIIFNIVISSKLFTHFAEVLNDRDVRQQPPLGSRNYLCVLVPKSRYWR
jgi:hypothetical protein